MVSDKYIEFIIIIIIDIYRKLSINYKIIVLN